MIGFQTTEKGTPKIVFKWLYLLHISRRPGFDSRLGQDFFFFFATIPGTVLGPAKPPNQWRTEDLPPGVKRPGVDSNHSPPSSAGLRTCGATLPLSNTSLWRGGLVKHMGNFTSVTTPWLKCTFPLVFLLNLYAKRTTLSDNAATRHRTAGSCNRPKSDNYMETNTNTVRLYPHGNNRSTYCVFIETEYTTSHNVPNSSRPQIIVKPKSKHRFRVTFMLWL